MNIEVRVFIMNSDVDVFKFRKREGVIIMKKTKMINKKGFTLSELLMVIAIIVILSGATMIGVVSTINKTRENAAKLEENNGDNFESEAMVAVESAKGTAPSHVVNQEKVDTPTPAETTQAPAETTKTPAETTRAPAETTQAPAETTKAPVETTKTQGGGSGGGVPGSATIQSASLPSEVTFVSSVDDHGNDGGCTLKWNKDMTDCKRVTVVVTSNDNTFTRGWGMDNNPVISNNGHTITFVMEFNPYYQVPFQNGGTFSPNWGFANNGNLKVNISVSFEK